MPTRRTKGKKRAKSKSQKGGDITPAIETTITDGVNAQRNSLKKADPIIAHSTLNDISSK
jgi:hypothetical protein